MCRVDKSIETESRWVAVQGCRRGGRGIGVTVNGHRASSLGNKNALKVDCGDGATTL